jgi:hypothetical protein
MIAPGYIRPRKVGCKVAKDLGVMEKDHQKPIYQAGGVSFLIVFTCVMYFSMSCIVGYVFIGLPLSIILGLLIVSFILMKSYHISIYQERMVIRDLLDYQVKSFELSKVDGFVFEHKGYGPFKGPTFCCILSGKKYSAEVHYGRSLEKCIAHLLDQGIDVKVDVESKYQLDLLMKGVERLRVRRS